MIQETLKNLGLKDKEIAVYIEAMKLGRCTPAQIAKLTGINRATVYSVVGVLAKKGLLREDVTSKNRLIIALPPKDLHNLIDREKVALRKKEEQVEQAINELANLPLNTQYAVPEVRLLDETDLELKLREGIGIWEKSLVTVDETKTWWGFQDNTFADHFEDWIDWYWKGAPSDVRLKLISNQSGTEEKIAGKKIDRREIKFVEDTQFTATTWVLGEYLIMVYTNQKPFYAIEIHNPVMAHNYRELFKTIWPKY